MDRPIPFAGNQSALFQKRAHNRPLEIGRKAANDKYLYLQTQFGED